MLQLAPLLDHMLKTRAEQIMLTPDDRPFVVVDGRRAFLGQRTTPANEVAAVASELVSHDELIGLPSQRPRIVRHPHGGAEFVVEVARVANGVSVSIRLGGAPRASVRQDPKPEAPPARVEPMKIEPTRLDEPKAEPKRRKSLSNTPKVEMPPAARPGARMTLKAEDDEVMAIAAASVAIVDSSRSVSEKPPARASRPPRRDSAAPKAKGSAVVSSGPKGLDNILRSMVERSASDLHLTAGQSPVMRIHGEIEFLRDQPAMTSETIWKLVSEVMPEASRNTFEELRDADLAYEIPGLARFRVNVFEDRNGVGAVMRQIPVEVISADKLGLPKACIDLCFLSKGLVVVTGPTGSGKSTTLAAMVDHINKNRTDHIITIEDPVEFVHKSIKCLVNQREVGKNTKSFKNALRAALREDPDIVLVGEMRDLETIAIAIETAETGHLVFGTLHTTTATSTIDRIIDQFPSDRQSQVRVMLSESLKGVVAQVLCKKKGGGRVAAQEILLGTSAVSALIRDGKTFQLPSVMQTAKSHGMVTMNDALFTLVQKGLVEPREAWLKAVDKNGILGMLKAANLPTNFT